MDTLYNDATTLVRQFRNDDDHLQMISKDFYNALLEVADAHTPTEQIHARILAAAKQGAEQIELMRFLGSEVHQSGFALLSLTKGSKTPEFNAIMQERYGCTSLMELLRKAYSPFKVVHTWNTRTTLNRILVRWPDDHPEPEECQAAESSCSANSPAELTNGQPGPRI